MPSPKAVLVDIEEYKLNPSKSYEKIHGNGRLDTLKQEEIKKEVEIVNIIETEVLKVVEEVLQEEIVVQTKTIAEVIFDEVLAEKKLTKRSKKNISL